MALISRFRRHILFAVVTLVALSLALYAYVAAKGTPLLKASFGRMSQADADSCANLPAEAKKENPNKTQFVSCGGFFE